MKISEILTEEELNEIDWKKAAATGALAAGLAFGGGAKADTGLSSEAQKSYTAHNFINASKFEIIQQKGEYGPLTPQHILQFAAGLADMAGDTSERNRINLELVKKFRDTIAAYNLGNAYDDGDGVPQDYKKAMSYYLIVLKDQDPTAKLMKGGVMGMISLYYSTGQGVEQDYVKAYAWIDVSMALGSHGKESRDLISSHLTPLQINQGQAMAEKIYSKYK